MDIIRKLADEDIQGYVNIISNAYPDFDFRTPEDKEKLRQRLSKIQSESSGVNLFGLFREDKMLGGMRLHDFVMNFGGIDITAGGVGLVAVDLCHKKEKAAKELISGFIRHYLERGTSFALLYPFRPDFYKKMGFGYGTKINQYRVRPCDLPKGPGKKNIVYLNENDAGAINECYNRIYKRNHGFIKKNENEIKAVFNNPDNIIVGVKCEKGIAGYLIFNFKKASESGFVNDIIVKEMLYENREAFLEMMAFLNSQNDQISRVVINTHDELLHFSFADVRNGSGNIIPSVYHESNTQGVGLMYRIINTEGFFKGISGYNFNDQSLRLKINARDSLICENDKSLIVDFRHGHALINEKSEYDAEIYLDISDFSSMVMGAVDFRTLYEYGIADISDTGYIDTVNDIFRMDKKPLCITAF